MKRRLSLIILALLLVLGMSSCEVWYAIFGDPIVGTWSLTAYVNGTTNFTIGTGSTDVSMTLTVTKDAVSLSGIVFGSTQTGSGTWSKSNDTYTLSVTTTGAGTGTASLTGALSSDNKTLTLDVTANGTDQGTQTYTRQ